MPSKLYVAMMAEGTWPEKWTARKRPQQSGQPRDKDICPVRLGTSGGASTAIFSGTWAKGLAQAYCEKDTDQSALDRQLLTLG